MPLIQANGLTLAYETRGDPSDPPALLVMGLGAQLTFWPDAFVDALAARGFHVVLFDNRDAGLSTALDRFGVPSLRLAVLRHMLRMPLKAAYSLDDMARDTAGLIDALGLARVHLVGASMGGMIAQNVAAMFPEKIATLVSIMSTTGSRKLPPPSPAARAALVAPAARRGDLEGATRRLMATLRVIGSRTHPPDEGYLRAYCERQVRRNHNPAAVARQLVAVVASGDRSAILGRIAAPTLVIHGDEDPLIRPAAGEATVNAIREGGGRATLEMVRGMGHDIPLPLADTIASSIARHCRDHS